ncbi:tyrosine-protein phosphatase [Blastopirellula marina]|uniref:Phosphatase n=1 Tax=Blastopirellula marina TaxID=124 RepID=A0A2S8GTD5_9BACT|nr:tyrosine-protein phosphatase [Blastopirellula marina]PQO47670.1 phosphatase [Blastopirellula marina]
MKYVVLFSLFAIGLTTSAILQGGWFWLLVYPAISFALMSAAYLGLGPELMGKRDAGTLAPISVALLLPYLLLLWTVWHLWRLTSHEPKWNAINGDFLLGRRLLGSEMPPEAASVVDLTSEFAEPTAMRSVACYRAFPMLDATGRTTAEIRTLAQEILEMPKPVYLHCAQGHGRSGLLAAALLLESGAAKTADQAFEMVRAVRPGVHLSGPQLRVLQEIAGDIAGD